MFVGNTSPLRTVISDTSRLGSQQKPIEPKLKPASNHHNHQERPKSTSNELTSIESFNLDTHLDLNRYTYFNNNNHQQQQNPNLAQHQVSFVV